MPIGTIIATAMTTTASLASCSRLMTAGQKDQLFQNIRDAMEGIPLEIIRRQLVHFYRADPEYGIGAAKRLGLTASDIPSAVAAE
jgi:catalase